MIFQQMKLVTNVIPHFQVILTGQFISCIICMIRGHLQGKKIKYDNNNNIIIIYLFRTQGTCTCNRTITFKV